MVLKLIELLKLLYNLSGYISSSWGAIEQSVDGFEV